MAAAGAPAGPEIFCGLLGFCGSFLFSSDCSPVRIVFQDFCRCVKIRSCESNASPLIPDWQDIPANPEFHTDPLLHTSLGSESTAGAGGFPARRAWRHPGSGIPDSDQFADSQPDVSLIARGDERFAVLLEFIKIR